MSHSRLLPVAAFFALPLALAAGTDEQWEVSSKMGAVPGMPAGFAMPAQVHKVCLPPGKAHEGAAGDPKDCKITDMKTSGSHVSYHVECTGKHPMSGTVDLDRPGPDSYKGSMKVTSEGQTMSMEFAGKKIGNCTYEDLGAKAAAQVKENTDKLCGDALDKFQVEMFGDKYPCASRKADLCKKVDGLNPRTPDGFNALADKGRDWRKILGTCGQNADAVQHDACGRAQSGRNWNFVARNCEAETAALAKEHCAGRSYTALMGSEYRAICSAAASRRSPGAGAAPAAVGTAKAPADQPARVAKQAKEQPDEDLPPQVNWGKNKGADPLDNIKKGFHF